MNKTAGKKNSIAKIAPPQLKKHTAIVHCSNTLSLLQRKISNALLYHAYDNLLKVEEHQIRIGELCNLIGYKGHNYEVIKEALKGLISTVIEWNLVDKTTKEEDWTASTILASVNLKSSICSYAYSPRMKQLLHVPAVFAKINLYVQSHFRSSYGLALYENCIRYQGLPTTSWLEIELFRKIMGVPENIYPVFKDFKKRVMDKAIHEVNTFSTLFIEPEVERKGKQVRRVRFLIKERGKKKILGENQSLTLKKGSEVEMKLIELYGIAPEKAKELTAFHTEEYILDKIELVSRSQKYRQGKIENLAGLLIKAIELNYQEATPQSIFRKKTEKSIAEKEAEQKRIEAENVSKRLLRAELLARFNQLSSDRKEDILACFVESLGKSLYRDIYDREGIENILLQDQLAHYLKAHCVELVA